MTYYLLLDGDSSKDVLYDNNILGEESFGTFYVEKGMTHLIILLITNQSYLIEL